MSQNKLYVVLIKVFFILINKFESEFDSKGLTHHVSDLGLLKVM